MKKILFTLTGMLAFMFALAPHARRRVRRSNRKSQLCCPPRESVFRDALDELLLES